MHGRAEILGSYQSLFETFPDWHYVGQQLVIDGGRVAQEFAVDATHSGAFMGLPPSGRKFSIIGVRLFEMADGLIVHERRYIRLHRAPDPDWNPARQTCESLTADGGLLAKSGRRKTGTSA